jgi:hypothetical protein
MIKKLLIFWLLAPISSTLLACNPTETELIATEILDTFDDAGNTVEKYRNGIPLNEEEQNYFAKSFQAAIEKQLSTIDEKYKACNATGLCQARARVMQDLLEENRDIHEAILAQETYKFKGETIGRVKCEPAIFSTIEHYDVRFNDLPFGAKTKSTLQKLGEKWFQQRDLNTIKTELKGLIDGADWYPLFNQTPFDIKNLRESLLELQENKGAIISLKGISTGDATTLSRLTNDHALLVFKKEGHLFLIDSYIADSFVDVFYKTTSNALKNEDTLYDFLTYNFKRNIHEYQEQLADAETELRELNEALSTVPTREELDTIKSKINEVVFIKKFLRSNGFEDPYANFNSVINNFCITTRTGL